MEFTCEKTGQRPEEETGANQQFIASTHGQRRGLHGGEKADNCTGGWDKTCVGENPMAQRNYPCDNIIEAYFGAPAKGWDDPTEVGEVA